MDVERSVCYLFLSESLGLWVPSRGPEVLVEAVEPPHIPLRDVEIEDLGVLYDPFPVHRFRDRDDPMLEAPAD